MKFYFLGEFDSNGKSNLINQDLIPDANINDILPQISTLLPEGYKLHHRHPEYLKDNTIDVLDPTEIVITFVTEGAGYRNAVGYFIYPTANPPKSIEYIKECYFFYPNASKTGSGGALNPGDKIKLPFTFNYSNNDGNDDVKIVTPNNYVFQKGHSVGFIIYPNGWTGTKVNKYIVPYTSISGLNPERAIELKFHTACFQVPGTDRLVMGFEDLRRDSSSCDHDFNDVVILIDTDLNSVAKGYTNTVDIESEEFNPNIPSSYTIGYKKVLSKINGYTVEAVVTLYIPRSATTKLKSPYHIRLMATEAYVRRIVVVAPKTRLTTTSDYVGREISSGYSWYNNSFVYTVNTNVNPVGDTPYSFIHFFRTFNEAKDYDYTPTYGV